VARFGRQGSGDGSGGVRASGNDALRLTIDYVKQETLEPVKKLGRFLLWGVVGSLLLCIGVVLLLVGVLRLLQGETGAFHGNLSWLPYVIVIFVALGLAGLAGWRIVAGPAQRKQKNEEVSR
jgi:Putative Actinobacterial Holin-X, holin superfamily III